MNKTHTHSQCILTHMFTFTFTVALLYTNTVCSEIYRMCDCVSVQVFHTYDFGGTHLNISTVKMDFDKNHTDKCIGMALYTILYETLQMSIYKKRKHTILSNSDQFEMDKWKMQLKNAWQRSVASICLNEIEWWKW